MHPVPGGSPDDLILERHPLASFFAEEAREVLGARIYVESDPAYAAGWIDSEQAIRRRANGWNTLGASSSSNAAEVGTPR